VDGKVEIDNNIVFEVRPDGQHVFLQFPKVATASKGGGNVFGPEYHALAGGAPYRFDRTRRGQSGENSVVREIGFAMAPPARFDLLATSPAVDAGVDDPAGVYSRFQQRYGIDIRRDILGRPRPSGRHYDAGAFERPASTPASPPSTR
jgi:hypothetical protein